MVTDYKLKATADYSSVRDDSDNVTVEYKLRLIQNLDDNGEIPSVAFPIDKPENAQHLAFEGKTLEIPITWILYNDGTDKSNGTLSSSGIYDDRLKLEDVEAVDTSNDEFTIPGDYTGRISSGDTVTVNKSADNDGAYTVDTVNYDSTDDETDIGVVEDVNDGTGDGKLFHGIRTIQEQIIWVRRYIQTSIFGASWYITGGRFDDPEGDGTSNGTPVVIANLQIRETADNPLRAEADAQLKVGQTI